jgi:LEA14-like dessication related protein
MKTSTILILGAVAFVAYNAFETAEFAQTVNIIFGGVDIQNLNSWIVKMYVQNITDKSVVVNSMTGVLSLNGDEVANISSFQQVTVLPNSQSEIDVKISPELLSIAGSVVDLVNNTGSQLNFNATGNVNVDGLPILPFNLDKTVTV